MDGREREANGGKNEQVRVKEEVEEGGKGRSEGSRLEEW